MKIFKVICIFIILLPVFTGKSQVYLTEGFETGARPEGWTEETVSGNEPWRYRNGGHSPNDMNWMVPPEQVPPAEPSQEIPAAKVPAPVEEIPAAEEAPHTETPTPESAVPEEAQPTKQAPPPAE